MLDFEKKIISLLEKNNVSYLNDQLGHNLSVDNIRIIFRSGESPNYRKKENNEGGLGIPEIHLWEDQYRLKPEVVESRLLSKLGVSTRIYARETTIDSITQAQLGEFLNDNHLNVQVKAKYRYGLFHNDRLVAIAAYSRSCPIQHNEITYRSHELIRYCSLLNHTVVGGLSKLIKRFEVAVDPEHIMTYVDREWSDGKGYLKIGFEFDKFTPKQSFWLSPMDNRRYYKHEMRNGKSLQVLQEEGWMSIQNLGNIKLVKFLK